MSERAFRAVRDSDLLERNQSHVSLQQGFRYWGEKELYGHRFALKQRQEETLGCNVTKDDDLHSLKAPATEQGAGFPSNDRWGQITTISSPADEEEPLSKEAKRW